MILHFPRISIHFIPACVLLLLFIASCDDNTLRPIQYDEIGPFDTTGVASAKAPNGLVIYFHHKGHGDVITENHTVQIRYTGRRTNGEIFDSSFRNELDTPSTLRVNGMIQGFMQGLAGYIEIVDGQAIRMHAAREGSQRTLVIPPALGYGGSATHSLSADTLIFDIDVLSIVTTD